MKKKRERIETDRYNVFLIDCSVKPSLRQELLSRKFLNEIRNAFIQDLGEELSRQKETAQRL